MGDLAVNVRLNGVVVDDRVVPVRRMVRVGEAPGSRVTFPGADVCVVRVGKALALRGRVLDEGDEMRIALGSVDVRLRHTIRGKTPSEWRGMVDGRFLAAAMVIMAVGSWIDAAELWIDDNRGANAPAVVQRLFDSMRETEAPKRAAVSPPGEESVLDAPQSIGEGPRHVGDDGETGTGYYAWYRSSVHLDPYIDEAFARVVYDRTDVGARRRLAREAYDQDDWDTAAWHYRWVVQQEADDLSNLVHLAWAERRRGRHGAETELYRRVLDADPNHVLAHAGLAVALARAGRMDEVTILVENLLVLAPMNPITEMTIAAVESVQGHDDLAIQALDRALSGRLQLSDELRLEMRRDLALDPAFSSLRKHRRLRFLLHRHLGAAAPRPVR